MSEFKEQKRRRLAEINCEMDRVLRGEAMTKDEFLQAKTKRLAEIRAKIYGILLREGETLQAIAKAKALAAEHELVCGYGYEDSKRAAETVPPCYVNMTTRLELEHLVAGGLIKRRRNRRKRERRARRALGVAP